MTAYHPTDASPRQIKYPAHQGLKGHPSPQRLNAKPASPTSESPSKDGQKPLLPGGELSHSPPNVADDKIQEQTVENTCLDASYSSIKEDNCGVPQSFLVSPQREAVGILKSEHPVLAREEDSCTCRCRCGKGKKHGSRRLGGRTRSRSYSPSRMLTSDEQEDSIDAILFDDIVDPKTTTLVGPGLAPLEQLPVEILDKIIGYLTLDIPPAEYTPRNTDLAACLLTSRTVHNAALTALYRHVTIPHSIIFSKFLSQISQHLSLGELIRRLDLSHFTSVGMGRTLQLNSQIQNMTAATLLRCLELTPFIQEVLMQEHLDQDIDAAVMRKLFFGLPNLQSLDLCASSAASFVDAFSTAVSDLSAPSCPTLGLRRLCLHECFTLHSRDLELLLSRLPRLTHLDLFHTRVTDKALESIPKSARLTHLNLGRCSQISGVGAVDFIASHPAAKELVYLNLSCDISRYRLLWEADVTRLIPALPSTLRSLNLSGAKVQRSQIPLLIPLTKHLEELSIGYAEISIDDLRQFFIPRASANPKDGMSPEEENWIPCALHYIDLTCIAGISQGALLSSILPTSASYPLEVIEFGSKVIEALKECKNSNQRLGWTTQELGRRGWYVRRPELKKGEGSETRSNGARSWKMGSLWWGMRKIPVACGEVGGLYGHYMFKK